jgi:hypothetical protein
MKTVVVVTDSEGVAAFERALLRDGGYGFSILPISSGSGRTGIKAGDRVHPGTSSLLFTVVPEADLTGVLALISRVRDQANLRESTKVYVADVEEVG